MQLMTTLGKIEIMPFMYLLRYDPKESKKSLPKTTQVNKLCLFSLELFEFHQWNDLFLPIINDAMMMLAPRCGWNSAEKWSRFVHYIFAGLQLQQKLFFCSFALIKKCIMTRSFVRKTKSNMNKLGAVVVGSW